MINLLIVESDLVQATNLANYISAEFSDIRIFNISTTSKTAINIIRDIEVDLILLDLNSSDISGNEILDFIAVNHIEKYVKSVIVLTDEKTIDTKLLSNPYIFNFSNGNLDSIKNHIESWKQNIRAEVNYNSVKRRITKELHKLGYNVSHCGTIYLIDTIMELYFHSDLAISQNFTKTVYPIVARKYNKPLNNIKSNITRATIMMCSNCTDSSLKDFFGYSTIIEKPRTKEIVYTLLHKL